MKNIFKIFAACGLILFAAACSENDDPKPEPDYTPAELKSVTFYAADNTNVLTEDYAVAAIADEMVVRIPGGGKGKTLVATLTAGENDIIKIDGEEIDGKATVDASYPIDILVTNSKSNLSKTYVLKVGKVLETVFEHIATYSEPGCNLAEAVMAINPKDNMPYIFYRRTNSAAGETVSKGTVIKWNGASFDAVGQSGFTGGEKAIGAMYINFDKDGIPYVSYADKNEGDLLTVKKFTGGDWQTVGSAGFGLKANSSYTTTMFFNPLNNMPIVLYTSNDTNNYRRHMIESRFDGSAWGYNLMPAAPEMEGTSVGTHIASNAIQIDNAVYVAATFLSKGYYVFKFENGTWTTIVDGFFTGTTPHAAYINLFSDSKKNIYVLAGDDTANPGKWDMQLYKVDEANKTMAKYGNTVTVGFSSSRELMAAAVNPVTDEIVGMYRDMTTDNVMYSSLNKDLQWNDFTELSSEPSYTSQLMILYAADGTGYATFVSNTDTSNRKIELFKIGKEADELPE